MHPLLRARVWFTIAAVLGALGLLVVGGTTGGVACAAALAAFIFACFRGLHGEHPEDRTAGTGLLGGGGF
jgi:hypothetical protein